VQPNSRLDEAGLEAALRGLRMDQDRMAAVLAEVTGRALSKVTADVKAEVVLDPEKALDYGLVHEIRPVLFPPGAVPYAISETGDYGPSAGSGEPGWGEGA